MATAVDSSVMVSELLLNATVSSLSFFTLSNAVFFAERLCSLAPGPRSSYALATVHSWRGEHARVIGLLQPFVEPQVIDSACGFLYAASCLSLQRIAQAEAALSQIVLRDSTGEESLNPSWKIDGTDPRPAHPLFQRPDLASVHHLLGETCRRAGRPTQASAHFREALSLNPYLFSALEELCSLGNEVNPENVYPEISFPEAGVTQAPLASSKVKSDSQVAKVRRQAGAAQTEASSIAGGGSTSSMTDKRSIAARGTRSVISKKQAGLGKGLQAANSTNLPESPRRPTRAAAVAASAAMSAAFGGASSRTLSESHAIAGANVKKRVRSAGSSRSASTSEKTAVSKSAEIAVESAENNSGDAKKTSSDVGAEAKRVDTLIVEARQFLNSLLCTFGKAIAAFHSFRLDDAMHFCSSLPHPYGDSAWSMILQGKACYEKADYKLADTFFERAHQIDSTRFVGVEIHSTVLWHLRKTYELSYLSRNALSFSRLSPQAWCAAGNALSLNREHERALKCFNRALQLDPNLAYAHTLAGHEHVASEEWDRALQCFRHAIRIDRRHYNAWYGLGMIYFKQEKYNLAEFHFKKALAINQSSSVLHCYVGMVMHATRRFKEALEVFTKASTLDPKNALVRFQKAKVFFSMERYPETLSELEALKDYAPREAAIYFLAGQVHKRRGDQQRAMLNFSWAFDLYPKGSGPGGNGMGGGAVGPDDVLDRMGPMNPEVIPGAEDDEGEIPPEEGIEDAQEEVADQDAMMEDYADEEADFEATLLEDLRMSAGRNVRYGRFDASADDMAADGPGRAR